MPWPRTRWSIPSSHPERIQSLADSLGVSIPLAAALLARGFLRCEQAAAMLSPRLRDLVPPEALPGAFAAAERIRQAVASREEMLIFGDFDADGVCAATVLSTAIEHLGGMVSIFLPDRIAEGYGLSPRALDRALTLFPETGLVITVDCGIGQHEGCAACRRRGLALIVTDHHTLPASLPEADAVINPHLPGTPEALQPLAGVGVAFKLAHLLAREGSRHCFDPATLLPVVALGTVADVSPLIGENRILVHAGLERLNRGLHPGLAALGKVSRLQRRVTARDLAFRLGPRINAAGRIGDPMLAVELLRTSDPVRSREIAQRLDEINTERRSLERDACEQAFQQLAEEGFDAGSHRAAVVSHGDWHPGITGLVAGRVSQRFHVPTVAFQLGEHGEARGSARCPDLDNLDLMELLAPCSHLFLRHGGHRAAAGLSLPNGQVPVFGDLFRATCAAALDGRDLRPFLDIDAWVEPSRLTFSFHAETQKLEPCGAGHPPVCWGLRGMTLASPPKPMGSERRHWRIGLQTEAGGCLMFTLFNEPEGLSGFSPGDRLDVAFITQLNEFQGEPELQLVVEDLRPSE